MIVIPSLLVDNPELMFEGIWVSAKFFNPLVWTRLSTGDCWSR